MDPSPQVFYLKTTSKYGYLNYLNFEVKKSDKVQPKKSTLKNSNHILAFQVPQCLVKDYYKADFCYILKLVFGEKIEGQAAFCIYRNSTLELEVWNPAHGTANLKI